ncbi:LETM1 domain-containing protein 1 [Gouania willdenowi]|uniref:Letm1 RBD domain-containing protein n=1 Tax=Gouania willdenowi TaxID=441366 RepID=A0A8C5EPG5_GOUWI|nr:LETM1 domain-containing protein 1 [Gouania willdenowi]
MALSLLRWSICGTHRRMYTVLSPTEYRQHRSTACSFYSTSTVRRGVGRYVVSKLQNVNARYESFLQRRFPRFYKLHHTFVEGSKLLFSDIKEVHRIKLRMIHNRLDVQDLPYREMEKLREFRRNLIKVVPVVLISLPPFANYLVFVLMYFFPRQLLIPHYWTPLQRLEFRKTYHCLRARHYTPVIRGLQDTSRHVTDSRLQERLRGLCAKVQSGSSPKVSEILAVRSLFSGPLLGVTRMSADHMRNISPLLFLTTRLPGFLIGRRLNNHGLELLQLDRALSRTNPHQLSENELRQACYLRGLNADALSSDQCRDWLSQWLQVSTSLKDSEVSLLLHTIVFLSANGPSCRR